MKRFKHILGYIPHNSSDAVVLNWCGKIAKFADSRSVDIIICYEDFYKGLQTSSLDWGEFAKGEVARLSELAAEKIIGVDLEIIVLKDSPAKGVLERLSSGSYDLMVLPKESTYGISLVEKLARKSPVGVLIVPHDSEPVFSSILLGVDFADLCPLSLKWAEAFGEINPGASELHVHHVFSLPRNSRALQATDPHMLRSRLDDISKHSLNDFIVENSEQPEKWNQTVSEDPLPGIQMLRIAEELKSDLVVIGSHGRHALSVALLGGQTSDMIRETTVPLLIAKRKNESLGFLKQLLGLSS